MNQIEDKPSSPLTNLEKIAPGLLVSMLGVQVLFLGLLLYRVNKVENSIKTLYLVLGSEPITDSFMVEVSIDGRPILGDPDAPVTIVEFADFDCSACKDMVPVFDDILDKFHGDVKLVFRHYSLKSEISEAAIAAECANRQGKFWEIYKILFTNQDAHKTENILSYASDLELDKKLFSICLKSSEVLETIRKDTMDGQSYGVNSTPTIFINGYKLVGTRPVEIIERIVEEDLQK